MEPPPLPRAGAPIAPTTSTSTTSSSNATKSFPHLEILSPAQLSRHQFLLPKKRINEGSDVSFFLKAKAYSEIGKFLMQLNRSVCPRKVHIPLKGSGGSVATRTKSFPLGDDRKLWGGGNRAIGKLREVLKEVADLVAEVPPEDNPNRRFGNAAFRVWYKKLEQRAGGLLNNVIGGETGGRRGDGVKQEEGREEANEGENDRMLEEVKAYFLGGWGSAQRLDFGTGHELSFLAFLGCLWKLGVFHRGQEGPKGEEGEIERGIVLGVIEPYLNVVRKLILTYTLEPAGSHGVWGLDDHFFLPYILGSAQLTRPIDENEPMPLEGSMPGAPKPADIIKHDAVERYREVNMYFSAVGFINDVKKGPFWEHSPILFDISGIKDGWGKINKGMIKMFDAEVLGKFPVVQHFPFGSLFEWELDPAAEDKHVERSVHLANQPPTTTTTASPTAAPSIGIPSTQVPSAGTARPPPPGAGAGGVVGTRAPWAGAGTGPSLTPRGGPPDTGPPPPTAFPRGVPGRANNQFSVTKAPWAKD
ncbi:Serine/threonine-protein phosphatase 2A activator 1 [Podospora australis]|uniref:Serine/threonine-protein phosphatase 2A activator n=1 Tax=Podospora australis TaxID=1536484 RepID=A0AAN7AJW4_9PEZI|nr:Serine/threonine-protein phosphatase 2A activator 1 [Podospora australis]